MKDITIMPDIFTSLSLVPGAQKVIKRRRVRNRTRRAALSLASFCVILSMLSQSYLLNDRLQQAVITLAYFKLNLIRNEISCQTLLRNVGQITIFY